MKMIECEDGVDILNLIIKDQSVKRIKIVFSDESMNFFTNLTKKGKLFGFIYGHVKSKSF